ncbi:hypothetical protein HK405_004229 [Cladochytrium tenue]|nr:hypothetical protein HK405_004229 [Cladochytrium tenue]
MAPEPKIKHPILKSATDYPEWIADVRGHFSNISATAVWNPRKARNDGAGFLNHSDTQPAGIDAEEVIALSDTQAGRIGAAGYWTYSEDPNVFPGTFDQNSAGMAHIRLHISPHLRPRILGIQFVVLALSVLRSAVGTVTMAEMQQLINAVNIKIDANERMAEYEQRFIKVFSDLKSARISCPPSMVPKVEALLSFNGQLAQLGENLSNHSFWRYQIGTFNRRVSDGHINDMDDLFKELKAEEAHSRLHATSSAISFGVAISADMPHSEAPLEVVGFVMLLLVVIFHKFAQHTAMAHHFKSKAPGQQSSHSPVIMNFEYMARNSAPKHQPTLLLPMTLKHVGYNSIQLINDRGSF